MQIKTTALLLLCLNLAACSEFKAKETKQPGLKDGETFSLKLERLDEPNKFQVILETKTQHDSDYVILKSANEKVSQFSIDTQRSNQVDPDVLAGVTYTYSMGHYDDSGFQTAKSIQLEVIPDIVVEGKSKFELEDVNTLNIPRVWIKKDSSIRTLGKTSQIEIDEVVAEENGKIETFSVSDAAPNGRFGKPSGILNLTIHKITGPLSIEIRGQTGGRGLKGTTGYKGKNGEDSIGEIPEHQILMGNWWFCNLELWERLKNDYAPLSFDEARRKYETDPALPGGPGGQGFPGASGLEGGLTEDAYLQIPKDTRVIYEAGHGGMGGEGGDGGPGGDGGKNKTISQKSRGCVDLLPGLTGETGPQGVPGSNGPASDKSKLYINGELK